MTHTRPHLVVGLAACLALATSTPAQTPAFAPEARAVSRGPHETVWAWTTQVAGPDGQTREERHSFIQLQTGLNRWTGSQYEPAQVELEMFSGGAVSRKTAHRVIFPPQTPGEIDLEAPDGRRLRTQVLGLALIDTRTGESALIAEPKECTGQVVGSDTVIYADAFDAVKCDVRYTVSLAGVEQDLLIREHFSPKEWGFEDEQAVRVEVITEFLEQEDPIVTQRVWTGEASPQKQQAMDLPEVVDQNLDFGSMSIGSGQAFQIGGGATAPPVPVAKGWHQLPDNRRVLIESVDYPSLQPLMRELPQAAAPTKTRTAKLRAAPGKTKGQWAHAIPPAPAAKKTSKTMRLAQAPITGPAAVLDYRILNPSETNYTFYSTNTYYVSGPVYLYATNNVVQGGAVIKYAPLSEYVYPKLDIKGKLTFATDLYRPAIFTACTDASVGEPVTTGAISGYYADIALRFDYLSSFQAAAVSNVVIRYANKAFEFYYGGGHEARHVQMINCSTGVVANTATFSMRNVLAVGLNSPAYGSYSSGVWEHATFNNLYEFNGYNPCTCYFTNCLFAGITSQNGTPAGLNNVIVASASGVLKSAGGGQNYLVDNSPYRNAGTTNINPALAAELKQRTTVGPIVMGQITRNTILTPQAARDTDLPDLGWHAAPLDYWASGVPVADGVTVLATNGVTIGIDYTNSFWGFILTNAQFLSVGSPMAFNRIVRAHLVQEYGGGNPASQALFFEGNTGAGTGTQLRLRFTECAQAAGDGNLVDSGQKFKAVECSHSRFYNPKLVVDVSGSLSLNCGLTNSLWESGLVQLGTGTTSSGARVTLRNNLFRNTLLQFLGGTMNWIVRDNLFETMFYLSDNSSPVQNRTNAYYLTTYGLSGGQGNLPLVSLTYQAGPLGPYYQPTTSPLINVDAYTAVIARLYHFTTTTNQVKEANTFTDIGLHYMALGANGSPADSDGDLLYDYQEDLNGDGFYNSDLGETDWTAYNSANGFTGTPALRVYTPFK